MTAVIVEDGSIVANADSYISEANAAAFLTSRGDTIFAAISATNQGYLLRQATDYMVQMYRDRWRGQRVLISQVLDWPRNFVKLDDFDNTEGSQYAYGAAGYVVLNNVVPTEVQRACAMLALIANSGALAPDISRIVKRRKFDVIETEFDPRSPPYKMYRAVAMLLSPYLKLASGGVAAEIVRT